MERLPPALIEVWALAAEVSTARNGQPQADSSPSRQQLDDLDADHDDHDDGGWERVVPDVYIFWRARVRVATPRAEGRLTRVLDELAVYPKIVAPVWEVVEPVWDWEAHDPMIAFGFWVEGPTRLANAVITAKRALDYALRQAFVGAPDPPPGTRDLALAVELDHQPTVRFDEDT